jgi:NAD(P)-dependent dehydrogenase (short-subunit alcohol dehydrogenase family)
LQCELGDLASVQKCAEQFLALRKPLDVLICNAGLMAVPTREDTQDGLEKQIGCNHVGHFYLMRLLTPAMEKARSSRLVMISSTGHRLYDASFLSSPMLETEAYEKWSAYGNTKVSNLLIAKEFNARYKSKGMTAYSVNPGGIRTGLQESVDTVIALSWLAMSPFMAKSVPQGAATTVYCASQPGIESASGKYFDHCQETDRAEVVWTSMTEEVGMDASKKLWDATEKLLKEKVKSSSWWWPSAENF